MREAGWKGSREAGWKANEGSRKGSEESRLEGK